MKISIKQVPYKLYKNRYFLIFIFLFAYLQSIYIRIIVRKEINAYVFTPEAATAQLLGAGFLFLIMLYFIRKWQQDHILSPLQLLKIFGTSLLVFMILMQGMGFVIAWAFGNIERNFNQQTLGLAVVSQLLNCIIYGSFFLTYYYYQYSKKHQQKLSDFNQALAESKINQLKTQLNPHFLFNNLNILDQFIEEDKHKASEFLNEFAEIYRYVLMVSDKNRITIKAEIAFIQQYYNLIKYKYGDAYQLHLDSPTPQGYIVPLSLQLLVENAIHHNLGTKDQPIHIYITTTDNTITVRNNTNKKRKNTANSGRALKNLEEQYNLLFEHSIAIKQSELSFAVTIPIIHNI